MFNNIGKKIKILASVIAIIGICCSIMFFLIKFFTANNIKLGIYVAIFGSLFSWIGSFVLYGFGQLIENSDKIVKLEKKKYNKENYNNLKTEEILEKISESVKVEEKETKKQIKQNANKKLSNIELLNKADEQLKNISEYEINEIKKTFKDWHKEIKKLTMEQLFDRLENVIDWQSPYIVLCCIEIKDRM